MSFRRLPFQPLREDRAPAFVVRPRGQFRNIIGRRVTLEACDLAEIVDGVRSVGGTAADAKDKEPSVAFAHRRQQLHGFLAKGRIQSGNNLGGLSQVLFGVTHDQTKAGCAR